MPLTVSAGELESLDFQKYVSGWQFCEEGVECFHHDYNPGQLCDNFLSTVVDMWKRDVVYQNALHTVVYKCGTKRSTLVVSVVRLYGLSHGMKACLASFRTLIPSVILFTLLLLFWLLLLLFWLFSLVSFVCQFILLYYSNMFEIKKLNWTKLSVHC